MEAIELKYDSFKFSEVVPAPSKTLQFFITTMCNKRCRACFYAHQLGSTHMPIKLYFDTLKKYYKRDEIDKVILLGGEPTLYPNLIRLIRFNQILRLKTTIYTNGCNLKSLEGAGLDGVTIRIGVYGSNTSEKALSDVKPTDLPVTIVFMIRKDNIPELPKVAKMAEEKFNCKDFYISSIRDIAQTRSYWIDNEETVPLKEYAKVIQEFVSGYDGKMNLHISRRGVLTTPMIYNAYHVDGCRFGNIFPDDRKIICPFDISLEKYSDELEYGRKCNKNSSCILQKIVLKRV